MDERAQVAAQLGREPRAFLRVARRCPFGSPAVTEQTPYDDSGKPFPTGYYLVCPWLVEAVSRIEASGGVERWGEAVERSRRLAWSLRRANRRQRRRRRELAPRTGLLIDGGAALELGIAGVGRSRKLKCLHAHVAFALAHPDYGLGKMIMSEIKPLWPESCCSERKECGSRSEGA